MMINRRYIIALIVVFILGCVAAFALRSYDAHKDAPEPITDAQLFDIASAGFTLSAPQGFGLSEYQASEGILFSGMLSDGEQTLLLFCYANESGDSIADYTDQALVTYYMNAGYTDVRVRTLGDRRFICFSAQVESEDNQAQTWHVYMTWNQSAQLIFETQMPPDDALPILTTLVFASSVGAL